MLVFLEHNKDNKDLAHRSKAFRHAENVFIQGLFLLYQARYLFTQGLFLLHKARYWLCNKNKPLSL